MDLPEESESPQVADLQEDVINQFLRPFAEERVHEVSNAQFEEPRKRRCQRRQDWPLRRRGGYFSSIPRMEAEGKYGLLRRCSETCLLRQSISRIADKLKPYGFVRIYRSVLVNASFVEGIRPRNSGEYLLRIKGGKEYTVSRTYKNNLRSIAHSWIGTDSFNAN